MNVSLAIPAEWEAYIEEQVRSGNYASVEDYFLALLQGDRQRKEAREKLKTLLQEGLDSAGETVTSDYWQNLRISGFDGN